MTFLLFVIVFLYLCQLLDIILLYWSILLFYFGGSGAHNFINHISSFMITVTIGLWITWFWLFSWFDNLINTCKFITESKIYELDNLHQTIWFPSLYSISLALFPCFLGKYYMYFINSICISRINHLILIY